MLDFNLSFDAIDFEYELLECRAGEDYRLWLRFADGLTGSVYLGHLVGMGPFASWYDIDKFKSASIDLITSSVVWEDGASIDAETLYENLLNRVDVVVH